MSEVLPTMTFVYGTKHSIVKDVAVFDMGEDEAPVFGMKFRDLEAIERFAAQVEKMRKRLIEEAVLRGELDLEEVAA